MGQIIQINQIIPIMPPTYYGLKSNPILIFT